MPTHYSRAQVLDIIEREAQEQWTGDPAAPLTAHASVRIALDARTAARAQ